MEISKTKLGKFALLRHKKHRMEQQLFIVEGEKCVEDTLNHFSLEALICIDDRRILEKFAKFSPLTASYQQMEKLSSMASPPSVIAIYNMPVPKQIPNPLPKDLYLVLDGVQDPGNLGTIIRIADWFGIHSIFISHNTVDPYNTKTIQASMGAITRVNTFKCCLKELLTNHKNRNIYGTLLNGDDIYSTPLKPDGFIVMGNEGNGISPDVRTLINTPLLIPSFPPDSPHTDSLNVAMATAITVAEFRRQQTHTSPSMP